VLNPALTEMVAGDRITELRRAAAKRSSRPAAEYRSSRPAAEYPSSRVTAEYPSSRVTAEYRSWRPGASALVEATAWPASSRSIRHVHLANPQRAIGWFLVSVGLRLALPRARTGSVR
jgi:hypothetical protein